MTNTAEGKLGFEFLVLFLLSLLHIYFEITNIKEKVNIFIHSSTQKILIEHLCAKHCVY